MASGRGSHHAGARDACRMEDSVQQITLALRLRRGLQLRPPLQEAAARGGHQLPDRVWCARGGESRDRGS
eukprot:3045257-Alexandrium_andersonii.AAC.1